MTVECASWRSVERGTLKGFAKIRIPAWHLTIDDVAVHARGRNSRRGRNSTQAAMSFVTMMVRSNTPRRSSSMIERSPIAFQKRW
jgi:hypothetical protein